MVAAGRARLTLKVTHWAISITACLIGLINGVTWVPLTIIAVIWGK
jgi:hypothetical protein